MGRASDLLTKLTEHLCLGLDWFKYSMTHGLETAVVFHLLGQSAQIRVFDREKIITVLGDDSLGGAYVLRLQALESTAVQFGRFRGGKPIEIPAGEYVYVGSAMRGMGRRLVRHASRTDSSNPHPIRAEMLARFTEIGLLPGQERPFPPKRLHWHVDYLLEMDAVTLTHVIILRSQKRLETAVARYLLQQPETFIIEPGLGANDIPGNTHLLGVRADEAWQRTLPYNLAALFDGGSKSAHNHDAS